MTATQRLQISEVFDCAIAQQSARQLADAIGFSDTVSEEIVLVVAELASNLVRHAHGGLLSLTPVTLHDRVGLEIESRDEGPGMPDIEQALTDGYSTLGSLGYGLGTVNRLMDELDLSSVEGHGTRVVCRRWLRSVTTDSAALTQWDIGLFTRARRFAPENGDAYIVKEWNGNLLAGVIDGLGHGHFAQEAALAAQRYVETHYDLPLERIFLGVDRACRATRGVVMALARFDSTNEVSFAGIGNIEAWIWANSDPIRLIGRRGILGVNEQKIVVQREQWRPGSALVLHSDGLTSKWQGHDFVGLERQPAQIIANRLMRTLAIHDDDATVLVVKGHMSC